MRPPLSAPARPRLTGRALVLPLAAAGLAILLPWRAAGLLQQWRAISLVSPAAAQPAPATPTPTAPIPAAPVPAAPAPAAPVPPAAAEASAPVPAPAPLADDHPADSRLLAEVARRKAELDHQAAELQTRASQAAAAEQLARVQLAELTRLRQQVEALVGQQTAAAETDLVLLVGLYSNMKPVQAAAVLGKLDAPKAAAILQRLEIRSAGPILAAMEPAAALKITEELEQRHAAFRP